MQRTLILLCYTRPQIFMDLSKSKAFADDKIDETKVIPVVLELKKYYYGSLEYAGYLPKSERGENSITAFEKEERLFSYINFHHFSECFLQSF